MNDMRENEHFLEIRIPLKQIPIFAKSNEQYGRPIKSLSTKKMTNYLVVCGKCCTFVLESRGAGNPEHCFNS